MFTNISKVTTSSLRVSFSPSYKATRLRPQASVTPLCKVTNISKQSTVRSTHKVTRSLPVMPFKPTRQVTSNTQQCCPSLAISISHHYGDNIMTQGLLVTRQLLSHTHTEYKRFTNLLEVSLAANKQHSLRGHSVIFFSDYSNPLFDVGNKFI